MTVCMNLFQGESIIKNYFALMMMYDVCSTISAADVSTPASTSTVSFNSIETRSSPHSIKALVLANKPQQPSNQLQALVSKKPASVMPKPQWHAPWKLMRVRSNKTIL